MDNSSIKEVRNVLQQFQDGYKERNFDLLDEFVSLFARTEDIELIGIGNA